jgi:hypothetical protein
VLKRKALTQAKKLKRINVKALLQVRQAKASKSKRFNTYESNFAKLSVPKNSLMVCRRQLTRGFFAKPNNTRGISGADNMSLPAEA